MALTKVKAGNILLTTPGASSNDVTPATTAYVTTALANLADSAPSTLDTLNELAAALGDDANFSTTVTNSIAAKAPLASPTFTGTVEIPNLTISSAQGTDGQVLTSTGSGIAWEAIPAGTTINTNAVNRIITGSNTADTLEGQANLTFDGTTTVINNTSNADSTLLKLTNTPSTAGTYKTGIEFWSNEGTANNQTFNAGRIYSEYNGSNYINAGLTLGSASGGGTFNDELTLRNGKVGIGTTSPASYSKLDVTGLVRIGPSRTTYVDASEDAGIAGKIFVSSDGVGDFSQEAGHLVIQARTHTSVYRDIIFAGGINNASDLMRITGEGSVGIGTTTPQAKLHLANSNSDPVSIALQNSTRYYKIEVNSGNLQFFDISAYAERMRISSNGSIGAPNGTNIYNASDERLKQNISTLSNGIDVINALNPVQFNWVDNFEESENGKNLYGFIAQEVQEVFPDAVESFGNSVEIDDTVVENPLTVRDKFFIPVLVKAMQEQQALIESLTARIATLES